MPWEHAPYRGLGMDAIVIVCSRKTNTKMVCAWMLWLSFALGTRALSWFGHGCAIVCSRNTNVIMVWAWSHYFWYAFGTRTFLWFGRGCAIGSMLSEHERYYGLGVGALFIVCSVCSRNKNIITVWAWLRDSMLSEHERYYGVGMDALVIVCSQNTNVIMVWAWMLWHSRSLFFEKRDAWNTQYFGLPNTSNVWFVPRRPHPERSARCAFFARLRSGGANSNNNSSNSKHSSNDSNKTTELGTTRRYHWYIVPLK